MHWQGSVPEPAQGCKLEDIVDIVIANRKPIWAPIQEGCQHVRIRGNIGYLANLLQCGAEASDERDLPPVSFERGQRPHGSRILRGTEQISRE